MTLKEKLHIIRRQKSALLAFNFYNLETLKGVLAAASAQNREVILQLTQGSLEYMGLKPAVSLARALLREYRVTGWLHLDHSGSVELCRACLDAGFDSVMIDASEQPFAKNIKITRQVVKIAETYNAHVEAELGYVAKLGQDARRRGFTDPSAATTFVGETGVDALAVAIGSAHGFYKGVPELDLTLLSRINEALDMPLVLHGGSGIPDEQIRAAVERGICKINVATEIKNAFMKQIKKAVNASEDIDLRKVFPPAMEAVSAIVTSKLNILNSASPEN